MPLSWHNPIDIVVNLCFDQQIHRYLLVKGVSGMLALEFPVQQMKYHPPLQVSVMLVPQGPHQNQSHDQDDHVEIILPLPAKHHIHLLDMLAKFLPQSFKPLNGI